MPVSKKPNRHAKNQPVSKGFKVICNKNLYHFGLRRKLKASFSFVSVVEGDKNEWGRLISGLGLFRCRQTGEMKTFKFKCS